jgi:tRNA (mo5U34)-methyltransferase
MREPGWPKMAFLEHHFAGDLTNWWVCNRAGAEALLCFSGLKIVGRPDREMYLCEPDPTHPACITNWNIAEFLAATGQERQDETLFSNEE